MKRILKPKALEHGASVGILAPAGPVTQNELQPGIDLLEAIGHKVVPAPHIYQTLDYLAGDDDVRLQDLHDMFSDDRIKAIFCARGGYGTLRLLDKIDYQLIGKNPKIIVGYSDITALLLALHQRTGLVTFHGPVVRDLTKDRNRNLTALYRLISSSETIRLDLSDAKILKPGRAEGRLLGGNLNLICHLMGTPFLPSLKGALLFIEDRGEPLYRIDRMFRHLKLSGHLGDIAGLLAGGFEECGDISAINQLLLELVSDLEIPLISGLPVGHGSRNITVPIGLQATIDTRRMVLSVREPCVDL